MQKFPIWFGGAQIFFSKASVLFQPRVLFFRQYQNFPVTCFAVQFIFFRRHQHFPATCSAVVFSDSTKIFHSRGVLQFFFSDSTNFPFTWCSAVLFSDSTNVPATCTAVLFFPTTPKFSIHVFCSSFFSNSTNFPFTCSAVPFFPTAQIFTVSIQATSLSLDWVWQLEPSCRPLGGGGPNYINLGCIR